MADVQIPVDEEAMGSVSLNHQNKNIISKKLQVFLEGTTAHGFSKLGKTNSNCSL